MRLLVQVLPPQQGVSHAPSSEAVQMNLPVKPTDTFADMLPLIKKRFASLFAEEMPVLNIKKLHDIYGSAIYLDEEVIQFFEDETDQTKKKIYVIQAQDRDPSALVDAPRPHVGASKRSRASSSPEANHKRVRMSSWNTGYPTASAYPNAEVPASECEAVAGASQTGLANGQQDSLRADYNEDQGDSAIFMVADSQRKPAPDGILTQLQDAAKQSWPEEASPMDTSAEPIGTSRGSPELPFGNAETTMANGGFLKPALPASKTAVGGTRKPASSQTQNTSPTLTTETPDPTLQTTEPDDMTAAASQEEAQNYEGKSPEVRRRLRSVSRVASTPPSAQRPRESPSKPDEEVLPLITAPKPRLSPITSDQLEAAINLSTERQLRRLSRDDGTTANSDRVQAPQKRVTSTSPKDEEAEAETLADVISSSAANATPRTAPQPHSIDSEKAALRRLRKLVEGRPTPTGKSSHRKWSDVEYSILKEARAANLSYDHIHENYLPDRPVAAIMNATARVNVDDASTASAIRVKWSDEEISMVQQERAKGVPWKTIQQEHFPDRSLSSLKSLRVRMIDSDTPSTKEFTAGTQESTEEHSTASKTPTKRASERAKKREAEKAESERRKEDCIRRQINAKVFRGKEADIRKHFEATEAREAKSKQEALRRSAKEQEETRRERLAALQSSQASQTQTPGTSLRRSVSFSDAVEYNDSPTLHRTTRHSAAPSTQKPAKKVTTGKESSTPATRARNSSSAPTKDEETREAPPPNKKSPKKPRQDSESDDGGEYEDSDDEEGDDEGEDGDRSAARYLSETPSDGSSSSSRSRSPGSSPPEMPERKGASPYGSLSPSATRRTPVKGILKSNTGSRSKSLSKSQSNDAVSEAPKPAASSAKPPKPKSNDTVRQAQKPAAKPAAKPTAPPRPRKDDVQEKPATQVPKRPGATTTGKRLPSLADIGKMELTSAWAPPPDPLKGRSASAPAPAPDEKTNDNDSGSGSESESDSESSDSDASDDDEEKAEKASKKGKKGGNRFKSLLKRMGPINPFQGLF